MKRKIFLGLPSLGTRADTQVAYLRDHEKLYKDKIEFVYSNVVATRIFHDYARNEIVEEFLKTDCDAIWFIDADICPPPDLLSFVLQHWDEWEASGACYPIFCALPGKEDRSPMVQFTAYNGIAYNDDGTAKGIRLTAVPRDGDKQWIDALATGCMFLKRSVFDKLERPFFEFKYNEKTRAIKEGEDLGFCLKLNKVGIRFLTDLGMVCKHYKNVCLLDVNNYAMEMANAKLLEYDKDVRQKIEQGLAAAEQRGRMKALEEMRMQKEKQKSGLILPSHF